MYSLSYVVLIAIAAFALAGVFLVIREVIGFEKDLFRSFFR